MTAKDFVGKYAEHNYYGRVFVSSRPKAARSKVNIKVVQRGPGWDEVTEQYRKVKRVRLHPDAGPGAKTLSWTTTKKDEYGVEDTVHIRNLKLIDIKL